MSETAAEAPAPAPDAPSYEPGGVDDPANPYGNWAVPPPIDDKTADEIREGGRIADEKAAQEEVDRAERQREADARHEQQKAADKQRLHDQMDARDKHRANGGRPAPRYAPGARPHGGTSRPRPSGRQKPAPDPEELEEPQLEEPELPPADGYWPDGVEDRPDTWDQASLQQREAWLLNHGYDGPTDADGNPVPEQPEKDTQLDNSPVNRGTGQAPRGRGKGSHADVPAENKGGSGMGGGKGKQKEPKKLPGQRRPRREGKGGGNSLITIIFAPKVASDNKGIDASGRGGRPAPKKRPPVRKGSR